MKFKSLPFLIILLTCTFIKSYGFKHKPSPPGIDGIYKFTGKLNGRIPVFLWFVVKDSVLKGEVTYLKTAKRIPITIMGIITKAGRVTISGEVTKENIISIYEFGKDGYITGTYEGEFNANVLTGSWGAPGSDKQLKFNLIPKDTLLNHIDTALKPVSVNGEYLYHFGKMGSSGGIDIKEIPAGNLIGIRNLLIDINCVTYSPQNNVADLENLNVGMINNTIVFKVPDFDCKFRIRAFKDFIVIDQVRGNLGNCGFGMGASIDGVFIKTSGVPRLRNNK